MLLTARSSHRRPGEGTSTEPPGRRSALEAELGIKCLKQLKCKVFMRFRLTGDSCSAIECSEGCTKRPPRVAMQHIVAAETAAFKVEFELHCSSSSHEQTEEK